MALLMAVSLVLLLAVLVGAMVISAGHSRAVSQNGLADLQNAYACRSALHHAMLALKVDARDSPEVDALHEPWARPLQLQVGPAAVTVEIEDAERRLNLARLIRTDGRALPESVARARRLFRLLNQDPDLVDKIADYADTDGSGLFEQPGARNDLLSTPDELLRVRGIDPEVLYGTDVAPASAEASAGRSSGDSGRQPLGSFVTVWPRERAEGKGNKDLAVNVNTADERVLRCLSDHLTESSAREIVARRGMLDGQGKPLAYASMQQLREEVPGIEPEAMGDLSRSLVFKSSTFVVNVTSRIGNLRKDWVYVVRRGGAAGLELLSQYQRHEIRRQPDPE